jgi:hypothetical protein
MKSENLIALNEFCLHHNIEISFISSLEQNGLIEIHKIQETGFIEAGQLHQLEKIVRLFYELDINLEGIETINHLLNKINSLQSEITGLKNRLRLYEPNE